VLVDSDALIWHLRGYPQATRRLDELGSLIAATAIEHRMPVLTANLKHFGSVQGLAVEAFTLQAQR
jgi:hypothetical protein